MTIFSFYIFDRHCECIYHQDFKRPQRQLRPKVSSKRLSKDGGVTAITEDFKMVSVEDDAKLVFGVVFSLRNMITKLAGEKEQFFLYRTSKYKLHFYETPSNLRFVLVTDPEVDSLRIILEQIYIGLYVEYVAKNALAPTEHAGGAGVNNELFSLGLDRFLRPLAIFD
ncbi:Longin-like domain-containing protein [Limtongia smithiae]|uniref:Longin-like domain-containing protein n=1 Tax=Limtongia smithiae TaxID=1125753 RepID=UPI0034CF6863